MQGIYNYIPEMNHVSRVYSVAAVLYLQFALCVVLFCTLYVTLLCPLNMFYTFTLVLYAVCVQRPVWLFSVVPSFRAFPICCSGIV